MKDPERTAKIAHAIELVWDSLQSHLPDAISQEGLNECCIKIVGDQKFHQKCVKEYGEIIHVLTDLL